MKKAKEIKIGLNDFIIDLVTCYSSNNVVTNRILQRRETKKEDFLSLLVELNPVDRIEDQALKLDIGSLEFVYNPVVISRLSTFFDVKSDDENLKAAAWDKVDKIATSTKETLKDILSTSLKKKVEAKIFSPLIILPFK